ncbi:MAG TPA: response regulator [Thermoanaerobaculia bacterium]|nr:response regulator [Thermoanaerobaculia bacterium]
MPKLDGRQLCKLIKANNPSIKVVVMTSLYTTSRYRVEAISAYQADEFLAKPINFAKLRQVLGGLSTEAA